MPERGGEDHGYQRKDGDAPSPSDQRAGAGAKNLARVWGIAVTSGSETSPRLLL